MLHELSHNVFGPHDANFHALWDQLRKEYEGLLSKGYTGEGFLSDGHKLGGRGRVPRDEARRIARNAAEKRRTLTSGSGQKLGGRALAPGSDIRRVIVDAIERRSTVLKGCGSGNKDEQEINDLANAATKNGFKTKADEDEADERAIAQALWELVQEDEKNAYGSSYLQPTADNPTGNGGGEVGPSTAIKREASTSPVMSRTKPPPVRQLNDRPVSRLVAESSKKAMSKPLPPRATEVAPTSTPQAQVTAPVQTPASFTRPTGWTCPQCTLHNPIGFLACDACTLERPAEVTWQLAEADRRSAAVSRPTGEQSQTWTCSRCTTVMEQKWWTCSTCSKMKDSS